MKTYSKARLIALIDLRDAARGASKAAETAKDAAWTALRDADHFLAMLEKAHPGEGQLDAARKAAADAKREFERRQSAYQACGEDWSAKATLVARAEEFVRDQRLTAA
jgi:RecA-family ATPase